MAVEAIVKRREERADDHDHNADIVELVEPFRDSLRVALNRVVRGRKAEADDRADEEDCEPSDV